MLTEEHFDLFRKFRIRAMGDKLREMIDDPAYDDMTFEDKMAELLETEAAARRVLPLPWFYPITLPLNPNRTTLLHPIAQLHFGQSRY